MWACRLGPKFFDGDGEKLPSGSRWWIYTLQFHGFSPIAHFIFWCCFHCLHCFHRSNWLANHDSAVFLSGILLLYLLASQRCFSHLMLNLISISSCWPPQHQNHRALNIYVSSMMSHHQHLDQRSSSSKATSWSRFIFINIMTSPLIIWFIRRYCAASLFAVCDKSSVSQHSWEKAEKSKF